QLLDDGGQPLSWAGASDDRGVTVSAAAGALAAGASSGVTVSVAAQAAAGTRTAHLTFDAGAGGTVTVPVSITFTAAPPPPPPPAQLLVTPLQLTFTAESGSAPAPQSVTVSNTGGQGLSWNGSVDDSAVAFAAASGTLAAGAAQVVTVSVPASTFAGTRTANLTIDAGAGGKATVVITIIFTQPPPPPPPPQYGDSAWPKWHHDNRSSGLSHIDTSGNVGALKWKTFVAAPVACINDGRTNYNTRCGTYVNSPVLAADGSVIQLGGDGNLYEFDRVTGKALWNTQTAPPWIAANEGTPTVVKDGSIFLMTAGESTTGSHWYKLSQTGSIAFQDTPGGTCNGIECDGWDSSPALDDDGNLFLAHDDFGAIQTWTQAFVQQSQVTLSPLSDIETQSAALADGVGYWSSNGHLWALTTAKQLWSFTDSIAATYSDWRPHASFHNIKSSPALTPDGKVVFTYVFETVVSGVTKQTTRVYAFAAGSAKKQLWMTTLGPTAPVPGLSPGPGLAATYADALHYRSGITSPAVGPDGTIYVGHCDGLYALDPATGKFKWGVGMSEVVSSPAVGKDGTVYLGSMDGKLHAISPAGAELWAVKTKGQLNSSPAIGDDGTVYVTSDDGYLYAVH
ncbi:MAG TPA: PQQ-binding-like beta-propeller repeat protein, partial [Myxococcales bacterium]|nr:PQQ-binding-like beta-propeller repeat protein [Myxococcales bacterium]